MLLLCLLPSLVKAAVTIGDAGRKGQRNGERDAFPVKEYGNENVTFGFYMPNLPIVHIFPYYKQNYMVYKHFFNLFKNI